MRRQLLPSILASMVALAACGTSDSRPARIDLAILPLELPNVGVATYDLEVEYEDAINGWTTVATVTGIESLTGGAASYVGPCVPGPSRVTVTVTSLDDPGGQPMDVVLPPPISEGFTCVENADTFVELDVFVVLSASQGFLDLNVDFNDLFCSAKIDCQSALLQHPTTGERGPTLVTGLACTGGAETAPEDNYVGFVDAVLCCDDGVTAECTFLGQDPANAGVLYTQTYDGVEAIAGKHYINTAWRLDDAYLASHTATCTFSAMGFVNSDPNGNPGTTYVEGQPAVHFFADVLSDGACGPDSAVTVTYSASGQQQADCPDLPDGSPVGPFETEVCNGADDDCDGLIDEDLVGCAPPDDDGDGVANALDNCPGLGGPADITNPAYNPGQEDQDGDGIGDVCDPDVDGDGVLNGSDNCPTDYNPDQADADLDGFGDACDVGGQVCGDGNPEAPEQCDEGAANSDAPDATCRTDCTLARCGDGIVDAGAPRNEVCDDGNPIDGDGCDTDCQTTTIQASATLPYYEGFDSSTTQMLLLTAAGVPWWAPGTPSWRLSTAGDLGPDPHPRYFYDAAASGFSTPLVSPLLDATGYAQVTWQFRAALLPNGDGASVGFSAEVSADAGATWQTVYSRGSSTALAPSVVTLDISAYIGNEPDAQLRYVVTGGVASDVLYVDVDDVTVAPGHAPSLGAVADAFVSYGSTQFVGVTATDADTAGTDLVFGLTGPGFLSLTDNHNGTASIGLAPTEADLGTHSATVSVSDGVFIDEASFEITVTPPSQGPGNPVSYVIVRTAPGGTGTPLSAESPAENLIIGESRTFYAAGYDASGEFVADTNVMWHAGGSLPSNVAGPQSSYTFTATVEGTGAIYATHPDPDVIDGQTGIYTVIPPPPGDPDPSTSTITATPTILIAGSGERSTVTVTLKDANGYVLTDPYVVALTNSGTGTLIGSVQDNGDGTYTQELEADAAVGTATLGAVVTVNGSPVTLTGTATVAFRTVQDVAGLTIDCSNYATYQGQDLVVQGGTLTINSAGCAPMEFGDVILKDDLGECIITHAAATDSSWQKIDMRVDSLRVEAGCRIDANGRGYLGGNGSLYPNAFTHGNRPDGPSGNSGGSHGGLGANGGFLVYGNLENPVEPGPGGGRYNTTTSATYRGGAGGGLIRITVNAGGYAVVDGQITADGEDRGSLYGSGGGGGGVFLDTPSLQGTGTIKANGGSGRDYQSRGFGGGGGRVAVVGLEAVSAAFGATQITGHITARGGIGYGNEGGAGTVFIDYPDETDGRLYVANANLGSVSGSTPLLCLPEGIIDLNPPPDASGFYDLDATLRPDLYVGGLVNPNIAQTAEPGFANHTLFTITGNTADRVDLSGAVPVTDVAASGDTYRGVVKVGRLIVTDGGHLDARACDLWLTQGGADTPTVLDVESEVLLSRADLGPVDTINVVGATFQITDTLIGSNSETFRYDLDLDGGATTLPAMYLNTLSATNGAQLTAESLDVSGNATVDGGADVVINDTLFRVAGTLLLTESGSTLTHPVTGAGPERALRLEVGTLQLGTGGAVDVTARGWSGGSSAHLTGYAPFATVEAPQQCGGSHGGRGGPSGCAHTYDSFYHPVHNGGGGGRDDNYGQTSARGGGSVEIIATVAAHLDGDVRANGDNYNNYGSYGAGGAGGSIYVEAPVIDGVGRLEAHGGNGHTSYSYGGGGGMIALVAGTSIGGALGDNGLAGDNLPWNQVAIYGGNGQGTYKAGSGLFYRRVGDALGDLMADNNGQATLADSTPLVFQGLGGFTAIDATTLTGSAPFDDYGPIDDYLINPKTGQGTASLGDDSVYRVTDTALSVVTFTGAPDPSGFAVPNTDQWSAYYLLDNLEIRGGARVSGDVELRVVEGDMASNDDTTFTLSGTLDVRTLDLNAVTDIELVDNARGELVVDTLVQGDAVDYPFDWRLNDGTLTMPDVYATTLLASGADVNVGTLQVATEAALAGGTVVTVSDTLLSVGGTLTVADSGTVIEHPVTGVGPVEQRLRLEVGTLQLGTGAAINVTARGWNGGSSSHLSGYAPYDGVAAPQQCGGSHGGRGGPSGCAHTYDSLFHPVHNGGGGGRDDNYGQTSARGGGSVEIIATSAAHLDGNVLANGDNYNNYGSYGAGGAGGSIYVEAPVIDGVGRLEAHGGNGHTSYSYGGGGGMIALVASVTIGGALGDNGVAGDNQPWTQVAVYGGNGQGTYKAGAGTFYRRVGAANGDLLVDNNGQATLADSTPLVFQGLGGFTSIGATTLTGSVPFDDYGPVDDYLLNPKTGQGTISLGDDNVYAITDTAAATVTFTGTPDPSGFAVPNVDQWSAYYLFDNVEIRGNARVSGDVEMRIVEGDISSNDDTSFTLRGTLDVRTLDLNAVTSVELVDAANGELIVDTLVQGTDPAYPFDWVLNDGVITKDVIEANSLTADGADINVGTMHIATDATFTGGTTVTVSDTLLAVDGTLTVSGTGTVIDHPVTGVGPTEQRLRLEVGTLQLSTGAAIDVTARGWSGGSSAHVTGYAPFPGVEAPQQCGGSHGGRGGPSGCAHTYDSFYHPIHNGGGGGRDDNYNHTSARGGGSVEIIATVAAHLDGDVRANGDNYNNYGSYGAGGAGGSIYVQAPVIDGVGRLEAHGGNGHTSYSYGGGGGMIALVAGTTLGGALGDNGLAGDNQPWSQVAIYGGNGQGTYKAGSGLFYRRVGAAHGDLLADNNGQATLADSTPLVFQGSGPFTSISATALTGSVPFDDYGPIDDYLINPKIGQGTASLGDDATYVITDTAASTVTFTGTPDPSGFAVPNTDHWSAYYLLDNLEIRGNARVSGDVEMRIVDGDISSNDDTSFTLSGTLDVRTLDLNAVTDITLVAGTAGEFISDTLIQGTDTAYPFVWTLNDGTLTVATVEAQTLTADGGDINVGTMHVASDAVFTGGTTVTVSDTLLAVDGTLTVSGSGTVIDHPVTGVGPTEQRLRLEVGTLQLSTGAAIDVTARGWNGGNSSHYDGYAPYPGVVAPSQCGGNHGGRGGPSGCGHSYDSFYHPVHNGGGGGRDDNYNHTGARGGGSVEILATVAAHLDGDVRANGDNYNNYGSYGTGGAGGSIYVEAPVIDGVGRLEAHGGNGHTSYSYGGGGGMIALVAGTTLGGPLGDNGVAGDNQPWNQVAIYGGNGQGTYKAGSGTFFRRVGAAHGDLMVDNNGQATLADSTPLVFQGQGAFTAISATSLTGSVPFDDYGPVDDYLINPKIGQGTPSLGDDDVYTVTDTAAATVTFTGAPDPSGFAVPNVDQWSAYYLLDNLEVRGKARLSGDVELRVVDGDISSNDDTTFALRGTLDVRTLDLNNVTDIALVAGNAGEFISETLIQGTDPAYPFAWTLNDGTLTVTTVEAQTLTADGGDINVGTMHVASDALFTGGTTVTISDTLLAVDGTLTVSGSGTVLNHPVTGTGPTEQRLRLEVGTLQLSTGAAIDVTGLGWAGGTSSHYNGYAPYDGVVAPSQCGGSHGGRGGPSGCGHTYDSFYHPVHNGGGGGRDDNYNNTGARGGGSVEIIASVAAHLDGDVRANGANYSGYGTGGAGGSIYVEAPVIDGVGRLEAHGGTAHTSYSYGGGGGMIALIAGTSLAGPLGDNGVAGDNQPWNQVAIYGGNGQGSLEAGSGTFFRRVGAAHGDLMVDNNGQGTFADSTPLVFQGSGAFTSITATTLTGSVPFDAYGPVDNYLINPKIGQGGVTLGDDAVYRVTATNSATVTFTGAPDPSTFATPNVDQWSAYYRLDNLEIRGNARVSGDVELRVERGDMASRDDVSLVLGGTLDVRTLDVGELTTVSVGTGAAFTVGELIGGASPGQLNPPLAWTTQGTIALSAISGASYTQTAGSLTTDTLTMTGPISLTDTTATVGSVTTTTAAGDLTLNGATTLTVTGGTVDVGGTLDLNDTSLLTHPATNGATIYRLDVSAYDVIIDAGARVDVTGLGWLGQTNSRAVQAWPDGGSAYGSTDNAGGSHGGQGFYQSGKTPGLTVGRFDEAYWPGGGGGYNNSTTDSRYWGGAGGGVVRITADNAIYVAGTIRANGSSYQYGSGGAGGAIGLTAVILDGTGVVEARGGTPSSSGEPGGGGRIVLEGYTTNLGIFADGLPVANNVSAAGGDRGTTDGGAGTIFMRPSGSAYGTLILDNDALTPQVASTVLTTIGEGAIDTPGGVPNATTINDVGANWPEPDYYAGTWLRGDVTNDGGTATLSDDTVNSVLHNTDTQLTLGEALPAAVGDGDTYRGLSIVEWLLVREGAKAYAEGDLLVLNAGARASFDVGTGSTLESSHQLELLGVTTATGDAGSVVGNPLVCSGCTAP